MNKKLKIVFNSPIVLGFVTLCFAATLIGILTNGYATRLVFSNYRSSMKDPLTYLRFFSHAIGHSGWSHFLGNSLYILLLGPMLEEKYRAKLIVVTMLLTAFITGLINFIFFPGVMLCGASGIVFSFIVLASFTGFREREIPITFLLVAGIYIGQQIYEGVARNDNISNMAHIVGGLVGAVVGFLTNRKKRS